MVADNAYRAKARECLSLLHETAPPARPRYGAKISLAAEPSRRGPPEMTQVLPATVAAPRPCRVVGIRT